MTSLAHMDAGASRRSVAPNGVLSIVDQAICSAGNFATIVLLSHALAPESFGAYVLIFNAILVFASVQHAIVTGPLRVLGAPRIRDDCYVAAQMRLQISLLTVELPVFGVLLLQYLRDPATVLAALAAMAVLQLHEFARSVAVTRLALRRLLLVDGVAHGVRVAMLAALFCDDRLSAAGALIVIAAAASVAVPFLPRRGVLAAPAMLGENWRMGRWVLADAVGFTLSTRLYLYLAALWLGAGDVAGLSAMQNLVAPINLVIGGLIVVAIPAAKLDLSRFGYDAWRSSWVATGLLVAAVGAALCGVVMSLANEFIGLFYPPSYAVFTPIVGILAVGAWLDACNTVLVSAAWTAERPQINVLGKILSAIFMVAWAYPAIHRFGIVGAALGVAAAPAIWLSVNAVFVIAGGLRRHRLEAEPLDARGAT